MRGLEDPLEVEDDVGAAHVAVLGSDDLLAIPSCRASESIGARTRSGRLK
jgi:hypothetical protein